MAGVVATSGAPNCGHQNNTAPKHPWVRNSARCPAPDTAGEECRERSGIEDVHLIIRVSGLALRTMTD